MAIIHSLKYTVPFLFLVPLFVICCHSLSFVVTRCHSLLLFVPLVVIRCHSLYHSLSLVFIRWHSMYLLSVFFINDHTTGTILCKYVFLFCATLNIFNQYESSLGCHIFFFATTYFFVTRMILVRNVDFYVKYFFC